jgi:hypothetical protein
MSYKPIGDPEATQLSPALQRAVSLSDSLERRAVHLADDMRSRADLLERLGAFAMADYTKPWGQGGAAITWEELYWTLHMVQTWAAADLEALPTQNVKRQAIIPKIPAFDRLKTQVERIAAAPAPMPSSKAEDECTKTPHGWQRGSSYGDAMRIECGATVRAVAEFEKHFGSFHIWSKQPQWATCESLVRAYANEDPDFEEYLAWMRRNEFRLSPARPPCRACRVTQAKGRVNRQCTCGRRDAGLDAYIVQVLLDMHTSGHDIQLGTGMQTLRNALTRHCKSDSDVYTEILRLARNRKSRDETYRHEAVYGGTPIKEPALSLDAPEAQAMDALFAQRQLNERFRWRPSIDWEKVAQCLDDRTARELGQVLAGATVEEMGEANYKHFRRALPKVRGIAWQLQ